MTPTIDKMLSETGWVRNYVVRRGIKFRLTAAGLACQYGNLYNWIGTLVLRSVCLCFLARFFESTVCAHSEEGRGVA